MCAHWGNIFIGNFYFPSTLKKAFKCAIYLEETDVVYLGGSVKTVTLRVTKVRKGYLISSAGSSAGRGAVYIFLHPLYKLYNHCINMLNFTHPFLSKWYLKQIAFDINVCQFFLGA